MVTADRQPLANRRQWLIALGFVVALTAAFVGGVVFSDDSAVAPATYLPTPLAVEATSVYQFASLAEMVAASDAIIVGTVTAAEVGRPIGDPATGAIISRLVTIGVESALSGTDASAVIIEEEGALADGTPIVVNGVDPTMVGDRGIWFLDRLDDAEVPTWLTINSQGRFLIDGSALRGGDQRDALVQALQELSFDAQIDHVRSNLSETVG